MNSFQLIAAALKPQYNELEKTFDETRADAFKRLLEGGILRNSRAGDLGRMAVTCSVNMSDSIYGQVRFENGGIYDSPAFEEISFNGKPDADGNLIITFDTCSCSAGRTLEAMLKVTGVCSAISSMFQMLEMNSQPYIWLDGLAQDFKAGDQLAAAAAEAEAADADEEGE